MIKNTYFLITFLLIFSIASLGIAQASSFKDIQSGHDFFDSVEYVKKEKIVQGYSDQTYQPDKKINRAEFTKIIIESTFLDEEIENCLNENTHLMSDVDKESWFSPYVCVANKSKIIQGYPDNTFRPAKNILFVEAAKIITIAFEPTIDDSSDGEWFLPYINSLDSKYAIPSSIQNYSHEVTRGEMAEMIYRIREKIENKESNSVEGLKNRKFIKKTQNEIVQIDKFSDLCQEENYDKTFSVEGVFTELGGWCDNRCTLNLKEKRDHSGMPFRAEILYNNSKEKNSLHLLPQNYQKSDIKIYKNNGEVANIDRRLKLTGRQIQGKSGDQFECRMQIEKIEQAPFDYDGISIKKFDKIEQLCQEEDFGKKVSIKLLIKKPSGLIWCNESCPLLSYQSREMTGFPLKIEVPYNNTKNNSMDQLPENYTEEDLKVWNNDGEMISLNQWVTITGKQIRNESGDHYHCRIDVEKIEQ